MSTHVRSSIYDLGGDHITKVRMTLGPLGPEKNLLSFTLYNGEKCQLRSYSDSPPSADSRWFGVSYKRKYVHEVQEYVWLG